MGPLRIVKVARSRDTGVDWNFCRPGMGIILSVFSCTVASPRRKEAAANLEAFAGLRNRANILLVLGRRGFE